MTEWEAPDERAGEGGPRFVVCRPPGAGVIVKRVSAAVSDGRAERLRNREASIEDLRPAGSDRRILGPRTESDRTEIPLR